MKEEIFELSLTPEYLKRIDEIIGAGGRSSLYGPEDPIAAMKQPNFDNERMRKLILGFLFRGAPDEHVKLMCQTNAYNLLH